MTRTADSAAMRDGQELHGLLRKTLIVVALCIVAVVVCYFYVDRPIAFFVYDHRTAKLDGLKWLTEPPPMMQSWSPLVLMVLAVRRAFEPWKRWQLTLFEACISVIVADQFRESMGDLFGRYWPETWHDNNPSLIGTGTYGFHPFEVGDDVGSFPSGHAARIAAFFAVFWCDLPRARSLYAILAIPMMAALVGMNYHFVSDVIAGATLGAIVGIYAAAMSRDCWQET